MFKLFRRRTKPMPAPPMDNFIRTKRGRLINKKFAYEKGGELRVSKSRM